MKKITDIIESLCDDSFPAIHLIDGKWGSGKTFFVKSLLMPKIQKHFNHNVYYLSLYGVTSISDFKDRILSFYISNNQNLSLLSNLASKAIDGAAQLNSKRGSAAVLSSVAGAIKHSIYSRIKNFTLIVDDLERTTDDKIIKNILGECLNLADSKNINVIIVANNDKISCLSDIEKTISSKTYFSYENHQVTDILQITFNNKIESFLWEHFHTTINSLKSTNLRSLKRSVNKFIRINNELVKDKRIIYAESAKIIFDQILRICHALHECNYTAKEISNTLSTSVLRQLRLKNSSENTDPEEDKRHKEIEKIFNSHFPINEKLIEFCDTGEYRFSNLIEELKLPVSRSILDRMLNKELMLELTDSEFLEGQIILETYISNMSNINLSSWLTACDNYIHYIDRGYISSPALSKTKIIELAATLSIHNINTDAFISDNFHMSFFNDELAKIYSTQINQLKIDIKLAEYGLFVLDFIKSWSKVTKFAYEHYQYTPFLNRIGIDNLVLSFSNWTSKDVFLFSIYLRDKYRFENIEAYFLDDHQVLLDLEIELNNLTKSIKDPRKNGTVTDLLNVINIINERMNEKSPTKISPV